MKKAATLMLTLAVLTVATGCTRSRPAPAAAPEPSWQATTAPSGAPTTPPLTQEPTPTAPAQYTAANVASHATPADCWVSVLGKVYNVTGWISRHPGGSQAIIRNCGKDISAYGSSHPGGQFSSDRLQQTLAEFYVGTLQS